MDWNGLGGLLAGIGHFLLQLLVFFIILLIGWLIAKSIAKGLEFLFKRLGFQRLLERAGISRLLAPTGIDPLTLVVKLVYYFILLIALLLALGAFGPSNPVAGIVQDIIAWLPRLFVAIVIVIVVAAIANFVGDLMRPALSRFRFGALLTRIVTITIIAMGAIAALNQIGVAVTVTMPILIAVLAALAGIAIVGIGGGLIEPMRTRWEKWLGSMESELAAPSGASAPPRASDAPQSASVPPAPPAPPSAPPAPPSAPPAPPSAPPAPPTAPPAAPAP
ncbi:hypothetical protein FVO59_10290 [Microbacterium esteraromaticum]|uniref:CmpX n=1 Tax=Microbacterium esteraromaticum TaxID=57043 RepID=A0A7D8AJQ8_9MICO|nr:hypothetical protein [Microbacterium esteraromaticum]QMU97565.1 hypothetical protein FVO59_10290 [Microbacterium esteraromaticum]